VSELILELKRSRPAAPAALRERVAELAAREPEPRRGWSWSLPRWPARRVALVVVPACLALAVLGALAGGLATSGSTDHKAFRDVGGSTVERSLRPSHTRNSPTRGIYAPASPRAAPLNPNSGQAGANKADSGHAPGLVPNPRRYQDYTASMRIRLGDVDGLSAATQKAMRLARRLGGYVVSVQYGSEGSRKGEAYLTLRVPVSRVQTAVVHLSGLGTILSQNVRITDAQQQVDALERRIVRLESDIAAVDAQLKSASLSAAERTRLQFRREHLATSLRQATLSRRATINRASYATVSLDLTTQKAAEKAAPAGRFHRTIGHAGGILAAEAAWTLLVLAVALPFVVLLALLFWGARAARRLADRRLIENA